MTGTERYLLPVLGIFALAWLGLALYVLLVRLVHEGTEAVLRGVQKVVRRAAGDDAELARTLRRVPRRLLARAVADPATPRWLSRTLAEHLMERHSGRIASDAQRTGRYARWRRVQALLILTRARWEIAVPLLADALGSEDEELTAAAVAQLGELGDVRAAQELVGALRRRSFARSRIAAQLDATREPIPQLLLPLLDEDDPQVRFWGATLLARYANHPGVVRELTRAATDPDPGVRAAAVESLATRPSDEARSTATELLADRVWFVRAHAARALRDLDEAAGLVVAPLLGDESWWVRAAAKETLEARPQAALETLLEYLEHDDRFARNGAAEVLQNAGVLDAMLAAESGKDELSETVQRILAAGNRRLALTAAARNGLDPEALEKLAASDR